MPQKLLSALFLLCLLSSCVNEPWVKDYVAGQTGEIKTRVQAIDKDVAENKARVAILEEGVRSTKEDKAQLSALQDALKDYEARLDALRHDLGHLDATLHEFASKTNDAMAKLEKDVHRDATTQEGGVVALRERVQKLDAEVVRFSETLKSMNSQVQELGSILYPLTGKEIKKR
ncbi:MAG TPA: hypothetical protein ACFYED_06955 [Candidatus Tripitaka californicus]|uniref:hypothetical protein n=1 Tax=Candidatus Tripitaka californicus TaxID=3367616 RepID=UPI004027F1F6